MTHHLAKRHQLNQGYWNIETTTCENYAILGTIIEKCHLPFKKLSILVWGLSENYQGSI